MLNKSLNYAVGYQALNFLFPVFLLPYILRVISVEAYGSYVFVNVIYLLVFNLTCVPIISYGIRRCSGKNSPETIASAVIETISMQLILNFIALIIISVIIFSSAMVVDRKILIIFLPSIFLQFINVDWFYFANKNYKFLFKRGLAIKFITLMAVLFFVKKESDIYLYATIISISYIFSNAISYFGLKKYLNLKFRLESIKKVPKELINLRYFLGSAAIGVGYQYLDQLIVNYYLGASALAHINILKQIFAALTIFPQTICRYYSPEAVVAAENGVLKIYHRKLFPIYILMVIISAVLFLYAGNIVISYLVGSRYDFKQNEFILIACLYINTSLAIYIDTQHSIPLHREKITTLSNVFVLISCLLGLIVFLQYLGYIGSIISLTIAEFFGVIVMLVVNNYVRNNNRSS